MGRKSTMMRFAKWHIWLGWVVGIPVLMWVVTGLVMVAKPIEEVRGTDLRIEQRVQALPRDVQIVVTLPNDGSKPVRAVSTQIERGEAITRITYMDGTSDRLRADGSKLEPMSDVEARMIVAEQVKGGDLVASTTRYEANAVPFDFRQPIPVWQVTLTNGTNVYVGTETGEIAAVRTRWWRLFDFMWGLHIMDPMTREDTHHPILIIFAVLSTIGAMLGCILLFRRRKARVQAPEPEAELVEAA